MLYKLKIKGTTFSGHPTRTTLGNTLRTLTFCAYLISLSFGEEEGRKAFFGESTRFVVYAAGDDVMIAGEARAMEQLSKDLSITHAPDVTVGIYGLGQCARELRLDSWEFVDFLSRDGYCHGNFRLTRKIDRVVAQANVTHKIPLETVQKKKFNNYLFASELNVATIQ